jgi:choline-sulfatase
VRATNLLFINSDQHSKRVLGCYGNPVVRTPNLDALAARGTRFDNAYCPTPICVPSRASLATGRYAHQIGSWDNGTPYVGTEAASWGHRLIDRGHKVTTIGKLHYRQVGDPCGFPDQRLPMHVLEGKGDAYGQLREKMPVRPHSRKQVEEAGAREVEYTRYDRAIGDEAVKWLREEGPQETKPWALFVSFVYPHFPLAVPEPWFSLHPAESLPLPVQWRPEEWPRHPVLDMARRQQAIDRPFDEPTIRNAMQAYYGMVAYMDDQVGRVLRALEESGQAENTRIIYSTDHGEQLGEHGLWWKSSMYEASVGIPLIVAGPDVPVAHAVRTPVSLVDCFPGILEATGVPLAPEDADLPGRSIFQLAQEPDQPRLVFSEYHTIFSPNATFLLRDERYKLIHYVGHAPMLFDMVEDPYETRDLAGDPAFAGRLRELEAGLRSICDPEDLDRQAKADQQRRIDEEGGVEAVIAAGVKIPYTPAPDQFEPAPVEARERARERARQARG